MRREGWGGNGFVGGVEKFGRDADEDPFLSYDTIQTVWTHRLPHLDRFASHYPIHSTGKHPGIQHKGSYSAPVPRKGDSPRWVKTRKY